MPSMSEIIAEQTELSEPIEQWLRLLVSEWQLLADCRFSDLVLWVPDRDANVFWAAAQIRPTTGPTSLFDDVVGDLIAYSPGTPGLGGLRQRRDDPDQRRKAAGRHPGRHPRDSGRSWTAG